MDLLHNVVLLRCPDSDNEFSPVSPTNCILYTMYNAASYFARQRSATRSACLLWEARMLAWMANMLDRAM